MENQEKNRLSVVNVTPMMPDEMAGVVPDPVISIIQQTCRSIDNELHRIKISMVEIGKGLTMINAELAKVVESGKVELFFAAIVQSQFGKKLSWAYQTMSIYEKFGDADPLYDLCSNSVLRHFTQLNASELEPIRTAVQSGKTLNERQAKSVVHLIVSQRDTGQHLEDLQEQLNQAMAQTKSLEKSCEIKDHALTHLEKQVDVYAQSNEKLIQDLLEKQEHIRNYMSAIQTERDEKVELKRLMEEERKSAKSKMQTVEVSVAPPGYTSIEEAIQAIDEKLSSKKEELDKLTQTIETQSAILLDEKSVGQKVADLFKSASEISISQHEIINRTRVTDLKKHRDEVEKVVQMLRDAADGLMRPFA